MSVVTTWHDASLGNARTGRPDVLIAYLEVGVNWHAGNLSLDLVNKVELNCGELPAPQDKQGKTHPGSSPGCEQPNLAYDLNGDGTFNIQDYASGLTYAQSGVGVASVAGSLLFPASGVQLKNFERIIDANTGLPKTASAPFMQGLDFLSSPLFVDVDGDGQPEVVDGGDSNALHAFEVPGGGHAAGFPKFHTGWMVWSASAAGYRRGRQDRAGGDHARGLCLRLEDGGHRFRE